MDYKINRRALLAAAPAGLAGALGILAAGPTLAADPS